MIKYAGRYTLAKGEELDALEDIVNNHIGSDETHVTAGDKQNWNGKADVAMLETEGYLKKKVVGVLPSMSVEFDFSDGVSKFNAINRCTVSVAEESDGNKYQKIVTGSNAANMYAFAYLDFSKYTANAKELIIEFDTKINTDRWYIGLSDLVRVRENQAEVRMTARELFSRKVQKTESIIT